MWHSFHMISNNWKVKGHISYEKSCVSPISKKFDLVKDMKTNLSRHWNTSQKYVVHLDNNIRRPLKNAEIIDLIDGLSFIYVHRLVWTHREDVYMIG